MQSKSVVNRTGLKLDPDDVQNESDEDKTTPNEVKDGSIYYIEGQVEEGRERVEGGAVDKQRESRLGYTRSRGREK